jgi:hypothetical protein
MTETLDRAEPESTGSAEPVVAEPRPQWGRTHTIWLLIALSFVPGAMVAMFREEWMALPAQLRAVAYLLSGVLIIAACGLIVMGGEKRDF